MQPRLDPGPAMTAQRSVRCDYTRQEMSESLALNEKAPNACIRDVPAYNSNPRRVGAGALT